MSGETGYEIENGTLFIRIMGDLDHHMAEGIREEADRLIDAHVLRQVVFDFSNSGFMDSSGIGVIMGRYKKLRYAGGHVLVAGVSGRLEKVFQLSGRNSIVGRYEQTDMGGKGKR